MAFEARSDEPIDYDKCQYGGSRLIFRGPKRSTKGSYLAFLGGSETFGKYVETPFVDLLETELGIPCFNFGTMNAGIDAFLNDPEILNYCSKAEATVVQIMGAQNMSNRFYSVHPRRNDRFLHASAIMQTIFGEVDFTEFAFTRHMLMTLHSIAPERFASIRTELQKAWVARMQSMMQRINGRKILLWVARRSPDMPAERPGVDCDPLFVNRDMIDKVSNGRHELVEIIVDNSMEGGALSGMQFPPMEVQSARELFGPKVHRAVAEQLQAHLQ